MKTIWKYKLNIVSDQRISMPVASEILTVQVQDEDPYLWALVDMDSLTEFRDIEIFGTGHPIDSIHTRKYIGTFQLNGFVGHVFEYTGQFKIFNQ
jgi:hypothetical protein